MTKSFKKLCSQITCAFSSQQGIASAGGCSFYWVELEACIMLVASDDAAKNAGMILWCWVSICINFVLSHCHHQEVLLTNCQLHCNYKLRMRVSMNSHGAIISWSFENNYWCYVWYCPWWSGQQPRMMAGKRVAANHQAHAWTTNLVSSTSATSYALPSLPVMLKIFLHGLLYLEWQFLICWIKTTGIPFSCYVEVCQDKCSFGT